MGRKNRGSIQQRGPNTYRIQVDLSSSPYAIHRRIGGRHTIQISEVEDDQGNVTVLAGDWNNPGEAVTFATDYADGNATRTRVSHTIKGTEEEARAKLDQLLRDHFYDIETAPMPAADASLLRWSDYWMHHYVDQSPKRRPHTADAYRRDLRVHIIPDLGHMPIGEIRPHDIRAFINAKGRTRSRSVTGRLHQILNGIFKEAWRNGVIGENPVAKVERLPWQPSRQRQELTGEQVTALLARSRADNERFHVLYRLLAYTGLRIGEALALQWDHLDAEAGVIRVRQTVTTSNDRPALGPPKNPQSARDVPISDPALLDALAEHRRLQEDHAADRRERGLVYEDQGLIFPTLRGGLLANRQVQRALALHGTHPHALRHWFGSHLFALDVPLLRISRLMGHANVAITAGIYVKPDPEGNRDAIAKLGASMSMYASANGTNGAKS